MVAPAASGARRRKLGQAADLERNALSLVAYKGQCALLALAGADPAAHAFMVIDTVDALNDLEGAELAEGTAVAAANAQRLVHLGDVTGRAQHGNAIALGLHGTAATLAAIADGIKAVEHGVLEEGMMDVAALVLRLQDGDRFIPGDPARALRLVLADEAGKRVADDQANIHRKAWMLTRSTARAVEDER